MVRDEVITDGMRVRVCGTEFDGRTGAVIFCRQLAADAIVQLDGETCHRFFDLRNLAHIDASLAFRATNAVFAKLRSAVDALEGEQLTPHQLFDAYGLAIRFLRELGRQDIATTSTRDGVAWTRHHVVAATNHVSTLANAIAAQRAHDEHHDTQPPAAASEG